MGFWNTICTQRRCARRAEPDRQVTSSPLNRILLPASSGRQAQARAAVILPDPLSPTNQNTCPRRIEKLTPSTASATPPRSGKRTERSRRSNRGAARTSSRGPASGRDTQCAKVRPHNRDSFAVADLIHCPWTRRLPMRRHELTDKESSIIQPLPLNKPRGVPRVGGRQVINGLLWPSGREPRGGTCPSAMARGRCSATSSRSGGGRRIKKPSGGRRRPRTGSETVFLKRSQRAMTATS